jgi:hypothetical protein
MLHQFTIIFFGAGGRAFRFSCFAGSFSGMSGRELPLGAPAGQPSKSHASTSYRCNPCLFVHPIYFIIPYFFIIN